MKVGIFSLATALRARPNRPARPAALVVVAIAFVTTRTTP
jgi:hypothetical protein